MSAPTFLGDGLLRRVLRVVRPRRHETRSFRCCASRHGSACVLASGLRTMRIRASRLDSSASFFARRIPAPPLWFVLRTENVIRCVRL